jgi:hypothetical protein
LKYPLMNPLALYGAMISWSILIFGLSKIMTRFFIISKGYTKS